MKYILLIPYISLFMLMPMFNMGAYYQSKIVIVCAILNYLFLSHRYGFKYCLNKSKSEWVFLFSILLYIIISGLSYLLHGDDMGTIRAFLHALIFVFTIKLPEKINDNLIASVIGLGGILLGIPAMYEYLQGYSRVGAYLNQVIFAQVAIVVFCISVFYLFKKNISGVVRGFVFLATLVTFLCVIFSGTRGAWLSLPIILIGLVLSIRKESYFSRKHIVISAVIASIALAFIYPVIVERYDQAVNDIKLYDKNNPNSSVGGRLYIWEASWLMIKQHPIVGVGTNEFKDKINSYVNSGMIEWQSQDLLHSHNEYIYAFAIKGIFGLCAYLFLILNPLISACKSSSTDFFNRILLSTIIVVYLVLAVSDVPLKYSVNIYMYTLVVFWLISRLSLKKV